MDIPHLVLREPIFACAPGRTIPKYYAEASTLPPSPSRLLLCQASLLACPERSPGARGLDHLASAKSSAVHLEGLANCQKVSNSSIGNDSVPVWYEFDS